MLSQEQAAKFMIVGWVKDWTIKTYLEVIFECDNSLAESLCKEKNLKKYYSFLPNDFIRWHQKIRVFMANNYKIISDKLFDSETNEQKLNLYKNILKENPKENIIRSAVSSKDMHKFKYDALVYQGNQMISSNVSDLYKDHNNSHWGTVKQRPSHRRRK